MMSIPQWPWEQNPKKKDHQNKRFHEWNIKNHNWNITLVREFSSRRKSNSLFGGTASLMEVVKTILLLGGIPGTGMLPLVIALISSAPLIGNGIHWFSLQALMSPQKLLVILSANFNRLSLPAWGSNTIHKTNQAL